MPQEYHQEIQEMTEIVCFALLFFQVLYCLQFNFFAAIKFHEPTEFQQQKPQQHHQQQQQQQHNPNIQPQQQKHVQKNGHGHRHGAKIHFDQKAAEQTRE